jgi:hypothetical protein
LPFLSPILLRELPLLIEAPPGVPAGEAGGGAKGFKALWRDRRQQLIIHQS